MELPKIQDCRSDIVQAANIKILAPQKLAKDCLSDVVKLLLFYIYPQGDRHTKKSFNLSWLGVQMYYHIFNYLAKLLNVDLTTKIGRGILSIGLIDRG